jgi:glutamate N-acetyltransferase / amino-acid N-acetyltransferase
MKQLNSRTGAKREPWKSVRGGVTAPQGFLASGVSAGIKKKNGLDLAVLFSSQPASAAAVFTCNRVQAAPVLLSRKHLQASRGHLRAALINSGCANACTGEKGFRDAVTTVDSLASLLGIQACQIAVASTGVIGEALPVRKMLSGISAAVSALSSRGGASAMRAIMTTDTREKTFAVEGRIGARTVRIGGMAKGSGMIHPNLATMLAIISTDAQISPSTLSHILRRVVDRTFNCVTVDGDTSTNDTVLVLANGASDASVDSRWAAHFERGLERVCGELAKRIAADGEGATKLVEIHVRGAASFKDARTVAKTIAHSPLVKTALFGEELNWGRILCAAGYSGVQFDPAKILLTIGGIPIFRDGAGVTSTRSRAERALKSREIRIGVDLGGGKHNATVWTCDLSREYVDINASYIS